MGKRKLISEVVKIIFSSSKNKIFFSFFSWKSCTWQQTKKNLVSSSQEMPKFVVLFPSATSITQPLWLWSKIGSRVKISHYIQPSNLSSALSHTFHCHHQTKFVHKLLVETKVFPRTVLEYHKTLHRYILSRWQALWNNLLFCFQVQLLSLNLCGFDPRLEAGSR